MSELNSKKLRKNMSFTKKSNLMATTDMNMSQTKFTKRNIVKMYTLKSGYPCTWKFMCQGFTYQNLQNKRTDHAHTKPKNVEWIIRGNNMLQYYTP